MPFVTSTAAIVIRTNIFPVFQVLKKTSLSLIRRTRRKFLLDPALLRIQEGIRTVRFYHHFVSHYYYFAMQRYIDLGSYNAFNLPDLTKCDPYFGQSMKQSTKAIEYRANFLRSYVQVWKPNHPEPQRQVLNIFGKGVDAILFRSF